MSDDVHIWVERYQDQWNRADALEEEVERLRDLAIERDAQLRYSAIERGALDEQRLSALKSAEIWERRHGALLSEFYEARQRLECLTPLEGTPAELVRHELFGLDEGWSVEEVADRIVGALYASGAIS